MSAPEGDVIALFLPEKSLVRYGMKLSEDVGDSVAFFWFDTNVIKEEINAMGFMCDFHAVRKKVVDWTEDRILVVRDDEQLFGENYFWPASEEALARYQPAEGQLPGTSENPVETEEQRIEREQQEELDRLEEERLLTYVEPDFTPREWKSLGSEREIDSQWREESSGSRPLIRVQISRARRKFGQHRRLSDLDDKDHMISCNRQIDKNYELRRRLLDGAFQSSNPRQDAAVQTTRERLVNKALDYESVELSHVQCNELMSSAPLSRALNASKDLIEFSLKQNECVNIFSSDLNCFPSEELVLGHKSENVKFFNTFVDLSHSKNRRITAVEWCPNREDVVAVSCAENRTFDQRVDLSSQPQHSTVLVWNFNDLIHPELVLHAPDEVFVFKFNPEEPNIVVAGLANGQVVLWDTNLPSEAANSTNEAKESGTEGSDANASSGTTFIRPQMVSYFERSHAKPVQDLIWIPASTEITKRDEFSKTSSSRSLQFISLAGEGKFLVWDIRGDTSSEKNNNETSDSSKWTPVTTIDLNGFTGVRILLSNDERRTAHYVSENGFLGVGSWLPKASSDDEIVGTVQPFASAVAYRCLAHDLACQSISRSPHFDDLFLTVGDWTFAIWRQSLTDPRPKRLFRSSASVDYLTCACWSPSRPGVIVSCKVTGAVDIWDLCDQSHRPSAADVTIAASDLSAAQFVFSKGSESLAIGDAGGNLHVVELPRNFRQKIPNELRLMEQFYAREAKENDNQASNKGETTSDQASNVKLEGMSTEDAAETTSVPNANEEADEKEYQQLLKKFKRQFGVGMDSAEVVQ